MTEETLNLPIRMPECITVFIAGPVASGKTFLIKRLVDRMERSLILDAGADYLGDSFTHIWSNPRELANRLSENPHYYRIAYHPNADHFAEEFHWCFCSAWSVPFPRWFVIEEAHEVCGNGCMHPDVNTILRYSRHNLLGVIASSQRIADVDKLLTGMARMVVLFNTAEYRDIEAIRFRWGPEVSKEVENLRPCIYNDATRECEQHPECLIYMKGYGYKVIPLGSKVKSTQIETEEEETLWLEEQEEDQQPAERQTEYQQSLQENSGSRESQLPEHTSEAS